MAEKTTQKKVKKTAGVNRGVNSRAEAIEKFKNYAILGSPNFANFEGELADYTIAMGEIPVRGLLPPVKKRTGSYTGDSREYVKKRAEKSRELLDKLLDKKAECGKVTGYKNGGCVMSGRGGKYKGMK